MTDDKDNNEQTSQIKIMSQKVMSQIQYARFGNSVKESGLKLTISNF